MKFFGKKAKANSAPNGAVGGTTITTTPNVARESSDRNNYANLPEREPTHSRASLPHVQRESSSAALPVGRVIVNEISTSTPESGSASAKSSIISESELKMPPVSKILPPSPLNSDANNQEALELLHLNEVTRGLVKQFISAIWNRGELELIPRVCSKGIRFNGASGMDRVGHDGFAKVVSTIRDALDEFHCEIHSMVVEANKAFCRVRFTGKHTSLLLGHPPTGRQVEWMGATEFTCKDGKIIKVWELADVKGLEEQLLASPH